MTLATADDIEITERDVKEAVNTIKEYFDKFPKENATDGEMLFKLYLQKRLRAILTEAEDHYKIEAAAKGLAEYRIRAGL